MNSDRLQHVLPAAAILMLAMVVAYLSFTQEPAESFLFPRIISVFFVGLSVWNFVRAASGMAKVGDGLTGAELKNMLPGIVVMLIYVFWGAKTLGFYTASTLTFFIVYTLYDPAPPGSAKDWIKRMVVTLGFMAIMYALFHGLLKVQTPRGMLF